MGGGEPVVGIHGTLTPIRIVEIPQGITAIFDDGAIISLTLEGVSECSLCLVNNCRHFRAAVPAYERRKLKIAESMQGKWGARKYRSLNLDPPEEEAE